MKKAAPEKRIWQLFFIVGGDEDQWANFGFDQLLGLITIKLHAIELSEQVVWKLNVGFVNLIDQQGHGLLSHERTPKNAFNDVILDVFDLGVAQLGVS